MDTNDSLRLASLWHSMHAISQQLSPVSGCTGIELLEADTFDLHCFQSLTGILFYILIYIHIDFGNSLYLMIFLIFFKKLVFCYKLLYGS